MSTMTMIINLGVTGLLLLISAGIFVNTIFFVLRAEKTTGIVVDYERRRGNKGGTTYAEIVEFQAPDGRKIRFTNSSSRSRWSLNTGHSVNVLYNPDKPEKARINSFFGLYFLPAILFIVGLCIIIPSSTMFMFSGSDTNIVKMLTDFINGLIFGK